MYGRSTSPMVYSPLKPSMGGVSGPGPPRYPNSQNGLSPNHKPMLPPHHMQHHQHQQHHHQQHQHLTSHQQQHVHSLNRSHTPPPSASSSPTKLRANMYSHPSNNTRRGSYNRYSSSPTTSPVASPVNSNPTPSTHNNVSGPGSAPNTGYRRTLRFGSGSDFQPQSSLTESDTPADKEKASEPTPDASADPSFNVGTTKTNPGPAIFRLSLLYDPPVESCELRPYVSLLHPDGNVTALKPEDKVEFRWLRGQKRICNAHLCNNSAKLQCMCCVRGDVPEEMGYFCSSECLQRAWHQHKKLHGVQTTDNYLWDQDEDSDEDEDEDNGKKQGRRRNGTKPTPKVRCRFPSPMTDEWEEVAEGRSYAPKPDDVGRALRIQVACRDAGGVLGPWSSLDTSAVNPIPPAPPPRRQMFTNNHANTAGNPFKIICYNTLAPRYATTSLYHYCEIWALSWQYRSTLLLREILSHGAHIICLQEVEGHHFEEFFKPELSKAGYDGLFKAKMRKTHGGSSNNGSYQNRSGNSVEYLVRWDHYGEEPNTMDGCAIFYKKDRFAMIETYPIDFNDMSRRQTSDSTELRRLLKGNIALIAVLEELSPPTSNGRRRRKRQLCVANTHIHWDPEFADVKLWQTWLLTQELEKLVLHRNLSLIVCGDFNSKTNSSVYQLLTNTPIDEGCDALIQDQTNCYILPQTHELTHRLPLASAYAAIGEPKYTNYTGHFVGTLDYIWYSKNQLVATSCLDVDSEAELSKYTALPSPMYPSDHICLATELDWLVEPTP